MKTAILGAGTIVPDFLETAKEVDEIELYAIFGRESSVLKMQELQTKYDIAHIFCDYRELLADRKLELVYVALPNDLHYSFAKQALEAGKHVILEKPFTANREQARELIPLGF